MTTPLASRRRVFLECTRTWQSSLNTGIERVVRKLTVAAKTVGAKHGLECHPVVYRPLQGFVPLETLEDSGRSQGLSKGFKGKLKYQLEQWRLLSLLRGCKNRINHSWFTVQSALRGFPRRSLQFGANDVLILLDSSWHIPYWKEIRHAQQNGAIIGAVIYDMLPAKLPETFTSEQIFYFQSWWHQVYEQADFLAAISQSVLDDVKSFIPSQPTLRRQIPGGAFRLGRDFTSSPLSEGSQENAQAKFPSRFHADFGPYYLCVGTFSPRKNQSFVLDAFESLWKVKFSAKLIFVGSDGWHSEMLIRRLHSHPEWGKQLFWFPDLSDDELAHLYQNARGLITASRGEGFNLPIVEALHHGCSVLASDIPVHREVAGGHARYFSLQDDSALKNLIAEHDRTNRQSGANGRKTFLWPTWQESCEEFLGLIQSLTDSVTNDCPSRCCG